MSTTKPLWKLSLELPAQMEAVAGARRTLIALLKEYKIADETLNHIGLAITEVLNNTLEHGGTGKPIKLVMQIYKKKIRIAIRAFSTAAVEQLTASLANAQLPQAAESSRGRGLFLIKSIMDKVTVKSQPKQMVEILLTKRF